MQIKEIIIADAGASGLVGLLRTHLVKFVPPASLTTWQAPPYNFVLEGLPSNLACADLADDVPVAALSALFDPRPIR